MLTLPFPVEVEGSSSGHKINFLKERYAGPFNFAIEEDPGSFNFNWKGYNFYWGKFLFPLNVFLTMLMRFYLWWLAPRKGGAYRVVSS